MQESLIGEFELIFEAVCTELNYVYICILHKSILCMYIYNIYYLYKYLGKYRVHAQLPKNMHCSPLPFLILTLTRGLAVNERGEDCLLDVLLPTTRNYVEASGSKMKDWHSKRVNVVESEYRIKNN